MRITLNQAISVVARPLNKCSTTVADRAIVADYINRACERMLYGGHWKDSYVRFRVCVNNACLTWPRELETIEAITVDRIPGKVRTQWYEFLGSGPGELLSDTHIGLQLVDRGSSVAFDEVVSGSKRLAVYCDATEAAGSKILLRFYDSNGNKRYSMDAGTLIEGEAITLPAAGNYAYTTSLVGPAGLYYVVKPVTNGVIRLFEYDVDSGLLRALAYYEPSEQVPEYRSSILPNLAGMVAPTCEKITVVVMGKKRFIPARLDDDPVMIPNVEAVRLACQAIRKEENNLPDEAAKDWSLAFQTLDAQTRHYHGSGTEQPMKRQDRGIDGPYVMNMI